MTRHLTLHKTLELLFLFLFISLHCVSFSQESGSKEVPGRFGGAITITNNGISLIPNLSLGKPAAIFEMNAGKRLSFEPQFRFALEGKPWSFILWWRYKLYEGDKFRINIGAHPAFAFRERTFTDDSVPKDYITVQRYVAGEIYSTYSITNNISTGIYFLHAYGLEKYVVKHTSLLALRLNFTNIKLYEKLYARFYPQVYYLRMDENDGFYFTSTLTFGRRDFPLSVSSIFSTPFETTIPQDKKTIWNISLTYTFNNDYVRKL